MYVDLQTKRQVYIKMRKLTMFITAVCVLIKLPSMAQEQKSLWYQLFYCLICYLSQ